MAIKFNCPKCQRVATAPDEMAGKRARCANCQEAIQIPGGPPAPVKKPAAKAPQPVPDDEEEDETDEPESKRSNTLLLVAGGSAGVVLLLVVALAYAVFSGGSNSNLASATAPAPGAPSPTPSPAVSAPVAPVLPPPPDKTAEELARLRVELERMKAEAAEKANPPAQTPAFESFFTGKGTTPEAPAPAPSSAPPKTLADLTETVMPSVVRINVTRKSGGSLGSGFVLHSSGMVVTNYHVIEGAVSAEVVFANKTKAFVSGFYAVHPGKDLAFLKVELNDARKGLKLVAKVPRQGETVAAFGSPQGYEFTVSEGIVSATRSGSETAEALRISFPGIDVYKHLGYDRDALWLQFTAPISHGNSGGPLVNMAGEVVGLATWADSKGQNVNFAISSREISELVPLEDQRVLPLAKLPAPAVPAVASTGGSTSKSGSGDRAAIQAKLSALRSIYDRGAHLGEQKRDIESRLQRIARELNSAQAEFARLEASARSVSQTIANLQANAQQLQSQAGSERDALAASQLRSQADRLLFEARDYQVQYANLNAQATKVNVQATGLVNQQNVANSDMAKLFAQSNQLRMEWLGILKPFERFTKGDHETAIAVLTEWIVLDTENATAYVCRALAYQDLGRSTEAANDLSKARLLAPADGMSLIMYAYAISRQGDKKAVAEAAKAVKMAPQASFVYFMRAKIYTELGQYSSAIPDLKKAVQLSPNYGAAHMDLAKLLAACPRDSLRNSKLALEHAQKATEYSSDKDWNCQAALGMALAEAGKFEEAKASMSKAIELAPEEARAQLQVCLALFSEEKPYRLTDAKD